MNISARSIYKFVAITTLSLGLAALSQTAQAGSRAKKKFGVSFGILSEPVPTLTSYQVKYNVTDWLQFGGSYGAMKSGGNGLSAYGVNAKLFLIRSWNLSPYVGGGFSFLKTDGDIEFSGQTIDGSQTSRKVIYASAGIDHQSNMGFNLGAGINYLISPSDIKELLPIVPGAYFGWVF